MRHEEKNLLLKNYLCTCTHTLHVPFVLLDFTRQRESKKGYSKQYMQTTVATLFSVYKIAVICPVLLYSAVFTRGCLKGIWGRSDTFSFSLSLLISTLSSAS